MHWNSASDFFAMGGYALYVWGSVGVTVVALVWETIALKQRRSQLLRSIRREISAKQSV